MIASQGLRLRKIRAIALLLAALSLLVVLLSAYLRLDGAGLGCVDWPACYGRWLAREPAAQQFGPVRLLHRVGASLSLLLACILVWHCWRRPAIRPAARPATLLLLLMLALSALGIWSADPRLTLVGFLNILGGLGLVTFSWRVVLASRTESMMQRPTAPTRLLRFGAALLSLTVVLGAMIGASYAALACNTVPDCAGRWWPGMDGWAVLKPFPTLVAVPQAGDPGSLSLHLLHRYAAFGTLLVLGAAALQVLGDEQRRKAALLLLLLLTSEITLGAVTVLSGFTLWLAIGHGVCAAALLATLATLLRRV
ncbi:MAG: COX15/CtaA family protein [Candidatus Accumulibacter sp.]|uniref:COX15/CtaA family protein n=1 Tax=Accumulibacter sp. TaxID=2053492 RepID=UPI001A5AB55B|nr:COX15/CtaA family protein [Accumulibacter sp.]MBL8396098.1 COX15/CtaA family protein [Accumulibacter sp.]